MDSNSGIGKLYELLVCSICLDKLDHLNRVLPCQHTFCENCLQKIISSNHELRCPECRLPYMGKVEDLPSNIFLIRILDELKRIEKSQAIACRKEENSAMPSSNESDSNCLQVTDTSSPQKLSSRSVLKASRKLSNPNIAMHDSVPRPKLKAFRRLNQIQ